MIIAVKYAKNPQKIQDTLNNKNHKKKKKKKVNLKAFQKKSCSKFSKVCYFPNCNSIINFVISIAGCLALIRLLFVELGYKFRYFSVSCFIIDAQFKLVL